VIFGLTFATFLTLVIVPVTYLLIDRVKMRVLRATGSMPKEQKPPVTALDADSL